MGCGVRTVRNGQSIEHKSRSLDPEVLNGLVSSNKIMHSQILFSILYIRLFEKCLPYF